MALQVFSTENWVLETNCSSRDKLYQCLQKYKRCVNKPGSPLSTISRGVIIYVGYGMNNIKAWYIKSDYQDCWWMGMLEIGTFSLWSPPATRKARLRGTQELCRKLNYAVHWHFMFLLIYLSTLSLAFHWVIIYISVHQENCVFPTSFITAKYMTNKIINILTLQEKKKESEVKSEVKSAIYKCESKKKKDFGWKGEMRHKRLQCQTRR